MVMSGYIMKITTHNHFLLEEEELYAEKSGGTYKRDRQPTGRTAEGDADL